MSTTTLGPTYVPIMQKPKCCAVACLQMILYRRGYGLYDQEDLAREFGVKIEIDDKEAFRDDMPIMTAFNFDEGISTIDSAPKINAFFKRESIPLKAIAHPYNSIADLKKFILEHLKANDDLWIEYHSHEIHSKHPGSNKIHDAVLESYDEGSNTVVLIDPKPTRRQRVSVGLDVLDESLSSKFGKELGIIVVQSKD